MENTENRDFKGVWIPREIWLDPKLKALDKVILTEIDSLDQGDRGCYASNKYIADFCGCSESKVSKSIAMLIEAGYIYVKSFDGRQRVLKSSLAFFTRQTGKIYDADEQKMPAINIDSKTEINTEKKERKSAARSYDERISEYTDNESLRTSLIEFVKARKMAKKPLTDYGLAKLLAKLDGLAYTDEDKIAIVDQSIMRGWQGFFPLKEQQKDATQQTAKHYDLDDIF